MAGTKTGTGGEAVPDEAPAGQVDAVDESPDGQPEDRQRDANPDSEPEDASPDGEPGDEPGDASPDSQPEDEPEVPAGEPGPWTWTGTWLRGPRASDPLLTSAAALALAAALCAAWSGWSWYGAAHDDSLHYSRVRDDVLQSGEQAIQNLNTLDYRDLGRGLKTWQDSSTSDLYEQIVRGRAEFEQQVRTAKTITSARILEGAVTELDDRAGRAAVIVAVQIVVTPPEGRPATKRSRLVGRLTRTATGWKLSALGQLPAGSAGS